MTACEHEEFTLVRAEDELTVWQHDCPPCEHGQIKGGTFTVRVGLPLSLVERQAELKRRSIDQLSCDGLRHPATGQMILACPPAGRS